MENSSRPRSREHSPMPPDNAEAYEKWVQQALAGLQLPHMPQTSDQSTSPCSSSAASPSIRILLVSDVDLPSASALAEYTLLQNNQVFDASRIDLCIACGPFCRDEDLLPYLKGKARKQFQNLFEEDTRNTGNHHHPNKAKNSRSAAAWSSVFFRSQEETAAMEGLVTAAISQLESIVCRVVFCPGSTDPMTTSASPEDLRFTPNSRNVHRQWLPLAPGLGCAGLLFLDAPTGNNSGVLHVKPPRGRRANQLIDYDSDEEVDGDCNYGLGHDHRHHHHVHHHPHAHHTHSHHSRGKPSSLKLSKVHGNDGLGPDSYCRTLERLIQIAPPPQQNYPFGTKFSQTILVTHYFQPPTSRGRPREEDGDESEDEDEDEDDDDGDGEEDDDDNVHIYGYRGSEDERGESNQSDDGIAEVSQDMRSEASTINHIPSGDDDDLDDDNNSFGVRPWPPEHSNFIDSPIVQEHLALEIASGGGLSQRPKEIQKGNVRIVIPGSLRERGEFCLVDMSLMEQAVKKNMTASTATAAAAKKKSTFAWRVRSVEFHNMERLP